MTEKQDDQQHSITTNDTSIPSIRPMNNDFNYNNRGNNNNNNNPNPIRYGPPLFDPITGEGGGVRPTMMMGMGGYRRSMAHPQQQQQQPIFHPPPAQYQAMQNRAYQQPIILSPSSMGQSTPLQQPPPPPPHYLQQQQQLMGDESEFSDELDPFIVDVLKKQQERIFLLKLEKELEAFINNSQ